MGKILIVEDDVLIAKVYATRLQADKYQVLLAEDGQTGLALAQKELPQVILLDLMMPKMSGLQVLAALKKDIKTAQIPVIVYSNLGWEKEVEKAKSLGAAAFITKANATPQQVVAKIESYLKKF